MNTEKDFEIFRYKDTLSEYLYGYCGLSTPDEVEESADSVVNNRGLHNAKPRIKLGLAQKFLKNRERIFRKFKFYPKDKLVKITKSGLGLNLVMRSIRSMDDSPSYLCFPRCFLKESVKIERGPSSKIVVYKKSDMQPSKMLSEHKKSIAATIDSIRDKRWYYRSDPFVFYDYWRRRKSGYLLSEEKLPKILRMNYTLPIDFRVFCPNADLFIREFASRTGQLPIHWHESTRLISELKMYLFKDAFEVVLPPDLIGEWREIKDLYKKNLYQLRNLLSSMNLKNRQEFKSFLYAARKLLKVYEHYTHQEIETVDEDILEILERYEEENLYTRIINEEYTVDDLLDDELDHDYFSFGDDSESESFPMEDFEVFEDGDVESEDEDLGYNEIRRIARQGNRPEDQGWD